MNLQIVFPTSFGSPGARSSYNFIKTGRGFGSDETPEKPKKPKKSFWEKVKAFFKSK